jgi:hypothetical protein
VLKDTTLTKDTSIKWIILKIAEDGTTLLVSDKATSNYITLRYDLGIIDGTLGYACNSLYGNSRFNAKNLELADFCTTHNIVDDNFADTLAYKISQGGSATYESIKLEALITRIISNAQFWIANYDQDTLIGEEGILERRN